MDDEGYRRLSEQLDRMPSLKQLLIANAILALVIVPVIFLGVWYLAGIAS